MTKRTKNIILIATVAILLLAPLAAPATEEPPNFQETPNPVPPSTTGTDDLIPTNCPLNPATDASTQNFRLAEFHSKDGTTVPTGIIGNIQSLMIELEAIRAYFGGRPLIITSGYRTPNHNANIGGATNSLHLCGLAADFVIPGISNTEVQAGVLELMAGGIITNGGLGQYNNFTHYDLGAPRLWDKRT